MQELIQKYLDVKSSRLLLLGSIGLLFLLNLICVTILSQLYATNLVFIILLVTITAGVCGIAAWLYIFRYNDTFENQDFESGQQIRNVPRGYKEIFSQPVDPIGNLHLWRITAEKQKKYLEIGPQIVEELENYLERHCDIYRIGSFGDMVKFDPDQHVFLQEADDSKGELDVPAKGARVKIIEPGWEWRQDQILRRPRVR